MKVPITQSEAWQKLQSDLGETSFLQTGKNYQYLAILKHTPAGNYLYCPYGPVYEDVASFEQAVASLTSLARQHHAIFIRIEPQDPNFAEYAPKSAQKSKDLNPKETWLLDLAGSDDDLKAKLPSRLLRYYKSASKKGITIETSKDPADIHYLLDLQKALAKEKGISTFSEHYLQTELSQPFATLYLVRCQSEDQHQQVVSPEGLPRPQFYEDREGGDDRTRRELRETEANEVRQDQSRNIIAAGLVFDDKTTRYNLQGAQSDVGRKLHATGILTIRLILDAKAKGLQTFDFWGIAPDGAPDTHPWAGFTNFKKTFVGYEQDYAGTYDLILSSAKYKLYKSLRKIRRLV